MKTLYRAAVIVAVLVVVVVGFTGAAQATSQWSRKYNMSCRTCHSTFPRLNAYGQRFMRNGYQDPDNEMPDGDEVGKTQLNDATFIDKLGNYMGVRLNVTPVQYKTNALTDSDGEPVDQLTLGNTNWAQFFVAGSIAKNMSIFIEMEFTDEKYHYSWYKLGYHNMFGSSLANLIVGNVPARDYGAYPNRLRIFGPIKGDVFNIKSSGGAAVNDESALNSSGSRPALQYYGYQGPFLVWGGVSPGDNGNTSNLGADMNDKLHTWGGVRLEVTEDMDWPIEGSAISAWYYQGTDTAGEVPEEETRFGPYENDYTRTSVEAEVRAGDFEVMAVYLMGKDENWALDDTDTEVEFSGISVVGGYVQELAAGRALHYGLQYDSVTSDDVPSLETTYVTPSISYFPRENVRIGLYGRLDMTDGREEDELRHDIMLNIRTMF
ncbi:MAG: hypothetical protein ABIG03_05395 [Candidatus Eisenbacteria bacterium]